ncbi:MAG: ABC transporter permease [Verrucomicrobia bacterium]|nr:ABC transporter permease [Verrucomicrobiota bacterium]MBV9272314.1 ABC transporter permease [Verrucomicrobiota bacterium]
MADLRSPWAKLRRNPAAITAAAILLAIAALAIAGPELLPANSGAVSRQSFLSPSWAHPFGTDLNGRDLLYRVLLGAQISLLVGIAGASVSFLVGTTYGLIAGYLGGRVDSLMMRFVDILYAIPRLIFLLVLISAVDPILRGFLATHGLPALVGYSKILILIACLGCTEWLTMARIIRGQVLSLKSQDFILAARSIGQSHANILFQHLLPNLVGVAIVYLTLTVPSVILDESFLSFLGVGVQAPLASWGLLLSDAAQVINPIKGYWWLLLFPAAAMCMTLLALNFLGDGLRDAFDPRSKLGHDK